jgi:glycine/D-amino acid oxidase-like deaminating enzyme
MPDDLFAPEFKETPYWWEAADPAAFSPEAPPPLPERTDIAIIGAGYAGLSCALELARRGIDCTVFDAEAIGFGASSRNAGMVSGGINVGKGVDLNATFGAQRAQGMVAEANHAYGHLEQILEREGIDALYQRSGRFVGAHTRQQFGLLERRAAWLTQTTGHAVEVVPERRQREEIGSDYYRGGILVSRAGGLHPALLMRGLADAATRAGARLIGHTRIESVAGSPGKFVLSTGRGRIAAREVMIATNGYTGAATPWVRRRLIPVASFIIATEELPPETIAEIIPKRRVIADTKRILFYFRLSPDGRRLLFGGRARFTPAGARVSAPILHRFMTTVFPQLARTRLTHAWTGNVAFSFDFMPHLGLHDGMHYAVACNGSGVIMQTWLGHQVALKIAGGANRPSAFDGLGFPTRPLYHGRPWFLPMVGAWYRWRDRVDRWLD